MSASLRLDVSSSAGTSAAGKTAAPDWFDQRIKDNQAQAQSHQAELAKILATGGAPMPPMLIPPTQKEQAKLDRAAVLAQNRQERDEAYADRQEARAAKQAERAARQSDDRQARDEAYAERQELKAAKEQERVQRQREVQQQRDEDFAARQQARDNQAKLMRDPKYIASQMLNSQQQRQDTQQEYIKQTLGIGGNGIFSRVADGLGNINSGLTKFGAVTGAASKLVGGLGFVAGAAHAAWRDAVDTLLREGQRVAQFSPALRMQELRNNMRNLRTDRQIAQEFGGQMASASDRENRQENAQRVISTRFAAAMENVFGPIADAYTNVLEWIAGTGKVNEQSLGYLQKLTNLSQQQLDAMGISRGDQQAIAEAMKIANEVTGMMGVGGPDDDPVNKFNKEGAVILDSSAKNPGLIPSMRNQFPGLNDGWN